jgi:hypothetical protein
MNITAFLSPLQFAFTISFHIIFPAFASGLTAECRDRARVHSVCGLWQRLGRRKSPENK